MARPTKLTDPVHKAVVGSVRAGLPRSAAFAAAGIHPDTGSEWIRRGTGRDDRPATDLYAAFARDIEAAEAEYQAELLGVIHTAVAAGDAKEARWLLERRFPQHWGREQPAAKSARDQHPLLIELHARATEEGIQRTLESR